ncbi:MAG: hypothetical protein WCQ60_00130 [bacterium]
MTPEEKNLLERTLKVSLDNNALLVKMNRRARNGHIFQVAYWLLIIGLSFGAYYIIQPYVNWLSTELGGGNVPTVPSASTSVSELRAVVQTLQNK